MFSKKEIQKAKNTGECIQCPHCKSSYKASGINTHIKAQVLRELKKAIVQVGKGQKMRNILHLRGEIY